VVADRVVVGSVLVVVGPTLVVVGLELVVVGPLVVGSAVVVVNRVVVGSAVVVEATVVAETTLVVDAVVLGVVVMLEGVMEGCAADGLVFGLLDGEDRVVDSSMVVLVVKVEVGAGSVVTVGRATPGAGCGVGA
jgi:hypothetical protein